MSQSQYSPFALSLEELGLFKLLQRIDDGLGEIDPLLRYGLAKQGLLIDDTPPRLSRLGLIGLQRLRERAQGASFDGELWNT